MSGVVVKPNMRNELVNDPNCAAFPWLASEIGMKSQEELLMHFGEGANIEAKTALNIEVSSRGRSGGFRDRISKTQLLDLGKNINGKLYMDEHTVRARAGLLNITSWLAIINILLWKESTLLYVLYPVVFYDMLVASAFGVVPLSPYGFVGAFLASTFGPSQPLWKPAEPKRFAWIIGFFLVNTCFLGWFYEIRPLLLMAVAMCNAATWAESALGFCVGCWMWNTIIAPRLGQAACEECKL
ncbi:unnamed protein product [Amoebophrya sp. A25]|nr:unnamed protein product [Amoebophrya sp. A25]|eukprot:GSA25T00007960001.1